jgi:16S rRNA (uracil1498-N3)-methyltransferase
MSERFYINWPLQSGPVTLQGAEAHHLAAVCRLRPDDTVCLFNGDGHEYPARVVGVQRRQIDLEILERATPSRELSVSLEVAAPLPKGDRTQFLVEKLTELGVTKFVPLVTARSVVLPREARMEKLERYVVEASKQCGRNVLMTVGQVVEWEDFFKRDDLPKRRSFGHRGGSAKLTQLCVGGGDSGAVWAVGPEGGFTDEEVEAASKAGWVPVDLGPRVLRVETAAVVGAAILVQQQ